MEMIDSVLVASIVVVGWVISVCFHEFAHALIAYYGGDKSVKSKGYLNFNPFAYTDIGLSIILPTLFILVGGIGLPGASVLIRDDQLRSRLWQSMVSAAGPFATFLFSLALVGVLKLGLLPTMWDFAFCFLLELEFVVLILNLLPIPGLDGFGIIEPFLSRELKEKARPLYKHGIIILIAMMWFVPPANYLLWNSADRMLKFFGVHLLLVEKGEALYRQGSVPVAVAVIAIASVVYFIKKKNDWYSKAYELFASGKPHECLKLTEAALARKEDPAAYRLAALCYASLSEKGQSGAGSGLYESEKNESKQNQNKTETEHITEKDNLLKAETLINKALALDPEAFENHLAKGFICQQSNNAEQALDSYSKTLELYPKNEFASNNKCRILWIQEKYDEMLAQAEKTQKLLPEHLESKFYKAVALFHLGRQDEALQMLEECIKGGLNSPECLELKSIIEKSSHEKSTGIELTQSERIDSN